MSNSSKTTVVIVTTFFPPINSVACNRMVAFAKYLNKEQNNVHVITIDESLPLGEELADVTVHRFKNEFLLKKFSFYKKTSVFIRRSKSLYNKIISRINLKEYRGWEGLALQKCKELITNCRNPVVISSYAPIEAHLVALSLKKQGLEFKWIADFRDEMSLNPYNLPGWSDIIKSKESEILKYADALTTVSLPFVENFKKMSDRNDLIFEEVRNGYDFDFKENSSRNEKFVVTYSGAIYASTDVSYFYAALLSLINEHKITDFEIRFVGVGLSFHIPENLLKYIVKTDRIPHKEAISEMTKADALLFMFPNNGWKGVYSGKLFEYLACRKPIIALTDPDDVAAELIRKCNSGFIATFDKVTEISEAFLKAYNLWKNKDKLEYNNAIIEQHHRKNQVAKLEKLIIELKK